MMSRPGFCSKAAEAKNVRRVIVIPSSRTPLWRSGAVHFIIIECPPPPSAISYAGACRASAPVPSSTAAELGLTGYARNLADGSVEVYAAGPPAKLAEMNQRLWRGPRFADVRGVEEQDAAIEQCRSFRIES
jgi:acylphosphatase